MRLADLQINKTAIIQYTLIFLMIQYIGGRLFSYFGSAFNIVIFLISAFFILKSMNLTLKDKEYFIWIFIIFLSMGLTSFATFGGLSIGTIFSIITRFTIAYAAISANRFKFCERFLKLSVFLCIFSWITFFITSVLNLSIVSPVLPFLPQIRGEDGSTVSYGLFLIVFNVMDKTRNSGIFGEPGEFQMLINLALYFTFFKADYLERKKMHKYLIVFLVTMLTNLSTTGMFNTIAFLIFCLFQPKKKVGVRIKSFIISIFMLLGIYILFFASKDSLIYTAFINKFIDNGQINFNQGTASARVLSFELLGNVIRKEPWSLILGVGYEGLAKYSYSLAVSGLIFSLIMFGIVTNLIIYGKAICVIKKYSYNIFEFLFIVFMIINNGLGQPDILSIIVILLSCYGMLIKGKKRKFIR